MVYELTVNMVNEPQNITIRKVHNTPFLLKTFIGAWYVPTFKTNFVAILQFFNYQGFK